MATAFMSPFIAVVVVAASGRWSIVARANVRTRSCGQKRRSVFGPALPSYAKRVQCETRLFDFGIVEDASSRLRLGGVRPEPDGLRG